MDADNSSTELHGKWLQANRPRPTMVRWNFAQGPFGVCVPNDGQQGVQHAGGRGVNRRALKKLRFFRFSDLIPRVIPRRGAAYFGPAAGNSAQYVAVNTADKLPRILDEILGADQNVTRDGTGEEQVGELGRQSKGDLHFVDDELQFFNPNRDHTRACQMSRQLVVIA
jgi:hypothetical protein